MIPPLRNLQYVQAVTRVHFRKAAEKLHVSQPAVSRQQRVFRKFQLRFRILSTTKIIVAIQHGVIQAAITTLFAVTLIAPLAAHAQSSGSPFDPGFTAFQTLSTGTIAKVARLVAIVIGGYR